MSGGSDDSGRQCTYLHGLPQLAQVQIIETMSWTRHFLSLFSVLILYLTFNSPTANATDAYPKTNDQSTTIAVPRWWYYGQTTDQITKSLNDNNARITHLRVEDPTVPTFAV